MRHQSSVNSTQSSLDHSMTIPEHDEFFGLQFTVQTITPDGQNHQSNLSSPSVSVTSLSSINGTAPIQSKHFRRSQTGGQLLTNRAPWSRYALRQISLDSSTSSLVSTTSSTAILIPNKEPMPKNAEFVSSKSACSIFGLNQVRHEDTTRRPKSSTLPGFEDKFVNLYSGHSTDNEDEDKFVNLDKTDSKHRRCYSVWRNARSSTKQLRQIMSRSASTGRLNNGLSNEDIKNENNASLKPPFFAYKVLPYLWIGNLKSANCKDLLSDGGFDYEIRMIRRRVYVDFGLEKHQKVISWPEKRNNLLDYMIPLPRRAKLTKKCLFLNVVEFCKIINKGRRDATQVLAYGQTIGMAQFFAASYLIIMFNKSPKTAFDLISARASPINIPDTLIDWLNDLRNFLERKSFTLGRLVGDIISVKNAEAERAYNKKYIIIRGNEQSTPNYQKFVCMDKRIEDSFSLNCHKTPLPLQIPIQEDSSTDNSSEREFYSRLDMWNLTPRPKSQA